MFFLSTIFIAACLGIAAKMVNKYRLQGWFISIPYLASIIALAVSYLLYTFYGISLSLPFFLQRLAVTIFLFSIGYQIALILGKKFMFRMGILIVVSLTGIAALKISSAALPAGVGIIFGSSMFAYNIFLVEKITPVDFIDYLIYWSSLQMIIVFMLTPLFLLISKRHLFKREQNYHFVKRPIIETLHIPYNREVFLVMAASGLFVFITLQVNELNAYFLHDFVFGLILGVFTGVIEKRRNLHTKKAAQLNQLGSIGLYVFIVSAINEFVFIRHELFDGTTLLLIFIKTILIGFLSLLVLSRFFRSLSPSEKLVACVAGWTFMLNAPVVCMHGMRTVVNLYGPAPYVLLIVPPVILWMVNYFHLWLSLIL